MDKKLYKLMNWPLIEEIVYSESSDPHRVLGVQKAGNQTLVQAFFPNAKEVYVHWIVREKDKESGKLSDYAYDAKMQLADQDGFYAALIPAKKLDGYYFLVVEKDGSERKVTDPYSFEPVITREDIVRFQNGIHYTIYEKLGAHPMVINGVEGVLFAVWAPGCRRVSVVGDFNDWDGRVHQMRNIFESGVFELFVPGVSVGSFYKFEMKLRSGITYLKADPYATASQLRPDTASIVTDLSGFAWEDAGLVRKRSAFQNASVPMSIYELYLGSMLEKTKDGAFPNYREIAAKVIAHVKEMGYTHVELMPVMEHTMDASWGYQITGYYAPTARYGTPTDFMAFVNELHKAGIGVILDWNAAHFPKDDQGLAGFDGTCLYEHQDPRKGIHPIFGTLLYHYERPEVSNFLIANALFWVEKYHVDGIRMDGVGSMLYLDYRREGKDWLPNAFGGRENLGAIEMIKHLNSILKQRNPGVLTIAEDDAAFPMVTAPLNEEGLGFDLKWNKGFVNDYLGYVSYDPYFRSHHHGSLTFSMVYAYTEKFLLAFSHEEVAGGKPGLITIMPGMRDQKFANLRLSYAYTMVHPGKKLLFMGQDLAEFEGWDENKSVDWNLQTYPGHRGVLAIVKALNELYKEQKALYELDDEPEGYEWINHMSANECYVSFVRKGKDEEDLLLVVANFSGTAEEIKTGVPIPGKYKEILNTDAKAFDGTGVVNARALSSKEIECDDRAESITIKLAPLSLSILKYIPFTKAEKKRREEENALIQAKEALKHTQEEEQQAQKEAEDAIRRAEALEQEAKAARLAAKRAKESLEHARLHTMDALSAVEHETEKLRGMKTKKED